MQDLTKIPQSLSLLGWLGLGMMNGDGLRDRIKRFFILKKPTETTDYFNILKENISINFAVTGQLQFRV